MRQRVSTFGAKKLILGTKNVSTVVDFIEERDSLPS
jgi:hypothetical protein